MLLMLHVMLCLVGTNRYFRKVAERMNIQTTFVDATDLELFRASMKPNTKVIMTMILSDLSSINSTHWLLVMLIYGRPM